MTVGTEQSASDPAIEELVFLARSQHRIRLLTRLSGEEQTRRELHQATGISQPTLGRILGDFERREWVTNHHDGRYTITPLGAMVADRVEALLGVLDATDELAGIADALPWDRFDFDPHHLADARITTPSSSDPMAPMRRFDELVAGADTVRMVSTVITCTPAHEPANADKEFIRGVDDLLVTPAALATDLGDSEFGAWLADRVAADRLALSRLDDEVQFLYGIFDDVVGIVPLEEDGTPAGLIEAQGDPVVSWGRDTFESDREAAERVAPDEIST